MSAMQDTANKACTSSTYFTMNKTLRVDKINTFDELTNCVRDANNTTHLPERLLIQLLAFFHDLQMIFEEIVKHIPFSYHA